MILIVLAYPWCNEFVIFYIWPPLNILKTTCDPSCFPPVPVESLKSEKSLTHAFLPLVAYMRASEWMGTFRKDKTEKFAVHEIFALLYPEQFGCWQIGLRRRRWRKIAQFQVKNNKGIFISPDLPWLLILFVYRWLDKISFERLHCLR